MAQIPSSPGTPVKVRKQKKSRRTGKPSGRPKWQPTPEQIGEIRAATRLGETQEDIASEMGVSVETLKKYCDPILKHGERQFLRRVHASLGDQALGRPAVYDDNGNLLREELKPVPTPGIFILKTQGQGLRLHRAAGTYRQGRHAALHPAREAQGRQRR